MCVCACIRACMHMCMRACVPTSTLLPHTYPNFKVQPIALEPPCSQLAAMYLDCLGTSMSSGSQPVAAEGSYQSSAEAMMMEDNCYKVVVVSYIQ